MPAKPAEEPAFELLVREVRLTFHALRAAAESLHDDPQGLTAGHRGVLESLHRDGPQTVPALARARPVSRQHIQVLVNRLEALRLVAAVDNPAHRRSQLIRLTPAGRQRFESMQQRERQAITAAKLPLSKAKLLDAVETLRQLRATLAKL